MAQHTHLTCEIIIMSGNCIKAIKLKLTCFYWRNCPAEARDGHIEVKTELESKWHAYFDVPKWCSKWYQPNFQKISMSCWLEVCHHFDINMTISCLLGEEGYSLFGCLCFCLHLQNLQNVMLKAWDYLHEEILTPMWQS